MTLPTLKIDGVINTRSAETFAFKAALLMVRALDPTEETKALVVDSLQFIQQQEGKLSPELTQRLYNKMQETQTKFSKLTSEQKSKTSFKLFSVPDYQEVLKEVKQGINNGGLGFTQDPDSSDKSHEQGYQNLLNHFGLSDFTLPNTRAIIDYQKGSETLVIVYLDKDHFNEGEQRVHLVGLQKAFESGVTFLGTEGHDREIKFTGTYDGQHPRDQQIQSQCNQGQPTTENRFAPTMLECLKGARLLTMGLENYSLLDEFMALMNKGRQTPGEMSRISRLSVQRGERMTRELLAELKRANQTKASFFIGRGHKRDVIDILKEKNVSYIIVSKSE